MPTPETTDPLPATTAHGRAREAALAGLSVEALEPDPAQVVTYASQGRLLILGPLAAAVDAARRVGGDLDVRVLATDDAGARIDHPDVDDFGPRLLRARIASISGYLGAFEVTVADGADAVDLARAFGRAPGERFDLVLDLGETSALRRDKLPVGYFHAATDEALAAALAELPEYVGEFDKPRYFAYDPSICAHGSRGQRGCTNCLDNCATEAIRSLGETIEVDPYLCLGCGSCATSCPTGAIGYTAPDGEALADQLRGLLRRFREAGGANPVILLHDGEAGAAAVAAWAPSMPESILPVPVEDVGGVGPDTWLAAIAFGASRVLLAVPPATPAAERAATHEQVAIAGEIIAGLGWPADRVEAIDIGGDERLLAEAPAPLVAEPARFAGMGGKRARLTRALAHLYHAAGGDAAPRALPAEAAFGAIEVDPEACTLCMACVSVCPAEAVIGGGEAPELHFREDLCVQCGLCERACPEDAITLDPRIDYAAHAEPAKRLLNEEPMHHCPGCGKPFATRKTLERMQARLEGHWMFEDAAARERLWLCADCRVKSMLRSQQSLGSPH